MKIMRWSALALVSALLFSGLSGCAPGYSTVGGGVVLMPCAKQVTFQNDTNWNIQVVEYGEVRGFAKSGGAVSFWVGFSSCSASRELLVRVVSAGSVVESQAVRVRSSRTSNPHSSEVFIVSSRRGNQIQIR